MGKCAFVGRECPKTNDESAKIFCPAWSEGVIWTNLQTGEEKIVNCSLRAMMPALVEVIKASNRPAEAIESTRNELSTQLRRGFGVLGQAMHAAVRRLPDQPANAIAHNSEG